MKIFPIPLHDRVQLIRIQLFFRNAVGNPLGISVGGALLALVLRMAGVSDRALLVWLGLIFLGGGILLAFQRHVTRVGLSPGNATRYYRIRATLGWEPRTPLRDALARTLEFYRANIQHYV